MIGQTMREMQGNQTEVNTDRTVLFLFCIALQIYVGFQPFFGLHVSLFTNEFFIKLVLKKTK